MAMGTLSNQQMGNASGVFNLMRNTGGSLGIAAMTTMLSRGAQIHLVPLIQHINPYNPLVQERIHEATGAFPGGAASHEGQQVYAGLYGMAVRQAMVLSYIDNFRMLAFICVICVPIVLFFKRVRAKKGPVAMH
jgi:DHA2 family multidrug resistance protein